jgi:hypothetical protein
MLWLPFSKMIETPGYTKICIMSRFAIKKYPILKKTMNGFSLIPEMFSMVKNRPNETRHAKNSALV